MTLGFKDDKGRFRLIRKYVGLKRKNKSTSNGIVISNKLKRKQKTEWGTALDRYLEFYNKEGKNLEGFTFDPHGNRGYDFLKQEEAKDFFKKYTKPNYSNNPVFVIGITNSQGDTPPRELESAYYKAIRNRRLPMFGFFKDDSGTEFTDISFPISDISRKKALNLALDEGQDFITIVFEDGVVEFPPTGGAKPRHTGSKPPV